MKKNMSGLLMLIVLMVSLGANAQDLRTDLTRIHEAYNKLSLLSIQVTYKVYKNKTDVLPFYNEEGEVERKDEKLYTKIGNTESIQTRDFNLTVSHKDKMIFLDKNLNPSPSIHPFLQYTNEVMSLSKENRYKSISRNEAYYHITFVSKEYEAVEIYFNKNTYLINKVVFYYKLKNAQGEQPKMEVIYHHYDMNPKIDNSRFSFDGFLTAGSKGTLVCNTKYKNYRLVNSYKK